MTDFKEYFLNTVFPAFCSASLEQKLSQGSYRYALSEFFSSYPSYNEYTYENCSAFLDGLQKKNKYSTCVKKRRQLASIFSYAIEHSVDFPEIPADFQNFFAEIPLMEPPQEIHPNRVISLPELDKIISYTKSNDALCMLAIMFAFKTMLRVDEFHKLRWSDIIETSDGFVLQVCSQGEQRYIFLPEDMARLLLDCLKTLEHTVYIFSNKENSLLNVKTLRNRLHKACDAAGIQHFTYNDLRNAGIAYASSQKCSINVLMQTLNIKKKAHISRLTSLSSLVFPDAAEYTNVIFKPNEKNKKEK